MQLLRSSRRPSRPAAITAAFALTAVLALSSPLPAQQRSAPEKLEPGMSCLSAKCHGGLAGGPKVHDPVAKQTCDACHDQEDEELHKFTYIEEGSELCYGCHESMTAKKFVHYPLKQSASPCISCHNPHSSAGEGLLKAKSTDELCLGCHDDVAEGERLHSSRAVGGCTGCHQPHSGDLPKLLRSKQPNLCYSCHDDMQEDIAEAPVVHGPLSAACTSCHNPHQTLARMGLASGGAELCMKCHDHFKDKFEAMSTGHSKLLEDNACLRCHQPHAAERKSLLLAPAKDLCLTCHGQDITAGEGRRIEALSAELLKDAHLHGPLARQNCGGCHEPHGNSRFSFLARAYPASFYSPYKDEAYALCFGCHDPSLAAKSHTTDATDFRNGDVNLHYLHVNKAKKGRTCRACHAAHASKNPHMLGDSVRFGQWKIPIGFTATTSGGTCASGCHMGKTYDRDHPVNYKEPPKPEPATRPTTLPEATTSRSEG